MNFEKKSAFGKAWHFIWESNSIWSWIFDFILAFIFIKFILFPLLSLTFSASLPMVIVESKSMIHQGDFDEWWTGFGDWYGQNNISKEQFKTFSFTDGINKGDIIVVQGKESYDIGDIIVFKVAVQKTPIIHRVVFKDGTYSTKGDNNQYQLSYEKDTNKEQIVGKAIARIPWLGWIKLIAVNPLNAFG